MNRFVLIPLAAWAWLFVAWHTPAPTPVSTPTPVATPQPTPTASLLPVLVTRVPVPVTGGAQ